MKKPALRRLLLLLPEWQNRCYSKYDNLMTQSQKVSISLSEELLEYAETYRQTHGLSSRSEVLARALNTLREVELAEGYKALSAEYKTRRDPFSEAIGAEGLEPSNETNW